MLSFRLGFDDTFLLLAPRGADLGPAGQIALLASLLALPLALVVVLYRSELMRIARVSALGLLSLRLALLFAIWCMVTLQPHLETVRVEERPSRVRIAVDLSASMDVGDLQRTPDEWSALAKSLHLGADEQAISRRAIAARILGPGGLNLLERLAQKHRVEVVGFDESATPIAAPGLLARLSQETRSDAGTDLRQPLLHTPSSGGEPLLGIVLISDGQHNVGLPPLDRADELGMQGVPIFPVVLGSRLPPRDLALVDVQAPAKAFKNATIPIEVRCKATDLPAQQLTVEMQIDGRPVAPEHRSDIVHDGKDAVHTVRFQPAIAEPGTHMITVKAASALGGEITLANNRATRIIRVADDKIKVLLIDGEARWEHHYLAMAFLRDPAIALERVVFSQPRIGAIKDDKVDQAGLPKTKLPEAKERDPLWEFDCIILGDAGPEEIPLAERRRLERYVSERGGTLVMAAGKRYLPQAYTGANDPFTKMLPITQPREIKPEVGFNLRVTGEGRERPFLRLGPDSSAFVWPELPRHYWGIVGKRRPAATVLMAPILGGDGDEPGEGDTDVGMVVEQHFGFGRVLFVGIDSTWRWRYRVGDAYHHRFWGQVARWSGAEKLLPAGNRLIRFGPREPAYLEHQEVELAVRLGETLPPLGTAKAWANLYRQSAAGPEEIVAVVPLLQDARQPNLLLAKVRDLGVGTYRMEPDIPKYRRALAEPGDEEATPPKDRAQFRVWARDPAEMMDLATNWDLLQALAERSGGKLLTPESAEEIVERLERRIARTESRSEIRPWRDAPAVWILLGLLLGLLALEWAWRKRLDLP